MADGHQSRSPTVVFRSVCASQIHAALYDQSLLLPPSPFPAKI